MNKRPAPRSKKRAAKPGPKTNPLAAWKKKLLRSIFPDRPARRPWWQPSPYEVILRDYAAYEREMNAEIVSSACGLKDEQDTATIAAKHAGLFAPKNVKMARQWADRLPGKMLVERHNRTAWALLEGLIVRKMAKISDQADNIAIQGRIAIDGRTIPFHDVTPRLSQEKDHLERQRLWDARLAFVEDELNPALVEENKNLLKVLRRLGFENQRQMSEKKKGVDFDELAEKMCRLAAETETVYMDAMHRLARRRLKSRFPGMSRAHEAYFLSLREFDRFFPAGRLAGVCADTFRGLGLNLDDSPNLRVDAEDRPRKDPCAFCVTINPPEEVHLVIKPRGGAEDYGAFLHEAGHAWHGALTDAGLPYEMRAMPRSYALTETYAFLLELLVQNPRWLTAIAGLDRSTALMLVQRQKLTDLYLLRRHIGKLVYELEFHRHPADTWRNRFYYKAILTSFTGVNYDDVCYLDDMDDDLYVADYLRAWMAEAQLREHLIAAYGEEWFSCPAAGRFLRSLWAKGDGWECEDLVGSLGLKPWDTSALLRRFAEL